MNVVFHVALNGRKTEGLSQFLHDSEECADRGQRGDISLICLRLWFSCPGVEWLSRISWRTKRECLDRIRIGSRLVRRRVMRPFVCDTRVSHRGRGECQAGRQVFPRQDPGMQER